MFAKESKVGGSDRKPISDKPISLEKYLQWRLLTGFSYFEGGAFRMSPVARLILLNMRLQVR